MRREDNQPFQIEIQVTNKCNWNCDYCLVDVHNMDKIPFGQVIDKIKNLPDNSEVTLSGGEPGLLKPEEMKTLLSLLQEKNCSIDLLTNGLFFKRHLKDYDQIKSSLYHCVETLDDEIEFPNMDQSKTIYTVVIKLEDFDNLLDFMDKYPHIKFMLSPNKLSTQNKKVIPTFMKFWNEHKNRLHERTYQEFVKNLSKRGIV